MGYVFRNATLTIATEASPDSTTGIVESASGSRTTQSSILSFSCGSKAKNMKGKICIRGTSQVPITKLAVVVH
jgi:hypothetical protein